MLQRAKPAQREFAERAGQRDGALEPRKSPRQIFIKKRQHSFVVPRPRRPARPELSHSPKDVPGDAEQVTIGTDTGSDLQFDPATVSVAGGGTVEVTFSNVSIIPHNLTFQDPINAATNTVVDPGVEETISFEAPAPGDYPFVCTLHPGMEGTLTIEGL